MLVATPWTTRIRSGSRAINEKKIPPIARATSLRDLRRQPCATEKNDRIRAATANIEARSETSPRINTSHSEKKYLFRRKVADTIIAESKARQNAITE